MSKFIYGFILLLELRMGIGKKNGVIIVFVLNSLCVNRILDIWD